MAIVDNACFGLRASGNLGDLNYYISRGRQIARSRKTTSGTPTAKQIVIQGYLTAAVAYWTSTLTQAQREAWVEYAERTKYRDRLGRLRSLPAYNVFVKHYVRSKNLGTTPITDPPCDLTPYAFDSYEIVYYSGIQKFYARPGGWYSTDRPDGWEWWMAGPFDSINRTAQNNEYYFEAYNTGFSWKYSGVKVNNKYYWHRIRWTMGDGRHGNWIEFRKAS